MWSIFKMCVCLCMVGYLLPPELRPSLTVQKTDLKCDTCLQQAQNAAALKENFKGNESLLETGLKSFLNIFAKQSAPQKAKLSNGQTSQTTLKASDFETPWQGNDKQNSEKTTPEFKRRG